MELKNNEAHDEDVCRLSIFVDLYHSEYGLSIIKDVELVMVTILAVAVIVTQVGVHVCNNRHVDGGYKVTSMLFIAKAALR